MCAWVFGFQIRNTLKRHSWWLRVSHLSRTSTCCRKCSVCLRENRPFLYLTDGGHIENLGLYQLLRRRCRLIIVIDAEADPKMAFNSFIKAERYARIDLGTRIELPWYEIRDATLETDDMIAERGDTGSLISRAGPHCALGTIYYPEGGRDPALHQVVADRRRERLRHQLQELVTRAFRTKRPAISSSARSSSRRIEI